MSSNTTPISPPTVPLTSAPPTSQPPISPISRTQTFPHKTSPAVSTQTPLIDTSTPAINAAPVEIDGAEMTVGEMEVKRRETGESTRVVREGTLSPRDEEDIEGEFLGDGRVGGVEKRAAMLASRSQDPGVIVDVPRYPTAEEVEAAKSADGTVTPGLPPPGVEER